jgi:phosphoribosyl 1,2-cyclic phosphodiesterase
MGLYDLTHIYNKPEKVTLVSTAGVLAQTRKKVGISMLSFRSHDVKPFDKFEIGRDTSVWFIPVEHPVEAYGIKIKAPKPILYAVEFRKIRPSSRKQLGDLELAIIDGSSKTRHGQAKGHETIEDGIRLGKGIRAKRVLFTNIGHKTDTYGELDKFVKAKGGDKFTIAFDGLEIKL